LFDRVVERNIDDDVFNAIKNDRKRSRVFITIDSRLSTKRKNRAKNSSRENLGFESNSKLELFFEKKKKKKRKKEKKKKKEEKMKKK
jgi:type III secretory pathway component EscR